MHLMNPAYSDPPKKIVKRLLQNKIPNQYPSEYICKHSKQNFSKLNSTIYKKHTSRPCMFYPILGKQGWFNILKNQINMIHNINKLK